MDKIRKEVIQLITINEQIQSAALAGDQFSHDETTPSASAQANCWKNHGIVRQMDKD